MGGQNYYKAEGGFSQYLYQQIGDTIEVNGIIAKVIEFIGTKNHHEGLPFYSNTSDMYLKIANNENYVEKAIVYIDRHAAFEFDWGHKHINLKGNGKSFPEGIVHVHELERIGKSVRRKNVDARLLTAAEIKKYGKILKLANPKVKFK